MKHLQPRHQIALALFGILCTCLGAGCTTLLFMIFEEGPSPAPIDGVYGPGEWSGGLPMPQSVDAEAWIQAMQAAHIPGDAGTTVSD